MALVSDGFYIGLTLRDQQANTSSVRYGANVATFGDAETLRDDLVTAYNAVTDAQIVATTIDSVQKEDAPANPAGAEVQEKASLTLQLANTSDKANLTLVSPIDALFVNAGVGTNGNTIDTANALLLTLLALWESGRLAGNLEISDGQAIGIPADSLLAGRRVFRSRRR